MTKVSMDELLAAARNGDRRALGRLLTVVEEIDSAKLTDQAKDSKTKVIGITGSPGVGKSSLTSSLISTIRAENQTVAVLAVDPSSPITGGALLGDRIRMQHHALDSGVFIRSMATRGHLGGLAKAAPAVIAALKLVGFDYLLIETVGVGQSEVEVATNSDATVVVIAPGMGDSIQAAKAGVFEIADIFVVNKSDRDGADASVRDLRQMLEMSFDKQNTPIIKTVATTGLGVKELLDKANEL